MILLASILAAGAGTMFLAGGYLAGARLGRRARAELAQELDAREATIAELRAREQPPEPSSITPEDTAARARLESMMQKLLTQETSTITGLREELRQMQRAVNDRDKSHEALARDIQRSLDTLAKQSPDADKIQKELSRIVSPLLARVEDVKGLRETVKSVLAPMMERDRVGRALAEVKGGVGLAELPSLLDAIAKTGAFSCVLLIDDVGLPLGASGDDRDFDELAGESSLLLTFADRAQQSGTPAPTSMLLRDTADRLVLHRIFTVGGVRFVLAAVSRSMHLSPATLDPALGKLERVLARREIAA